jgi:formate-dependent nitrite reductase membrane component NrfD
MSVPRDISPAVGTPAEPAPWRRAAEQAPALHRRRFADAAWSFLFGRDTRYRAAEAPAERVAAAARRGRFEREPGPAIGPIIQPAVWTWEVPLYFWCGGIAAGASFVAAGCELAGDEDSARIARRVVLGGVAPCAPLLIADLGRPARFLHMLRIFKPRSPMSTGAWTLSLFSSLAAAAVAADLARRPRLARATAYTTAAVATYFGSYTGVLLSSTAVPLWSRSHRLLGPIFAAASAATGASAVRLALAAAGRTRASTRTVAGRVEATAMVVELALAALNERRLGQLGAPLRSNRLFKMAEGGAVAGLALRLARRRAADHAASALTLAAGLVFRYAWVDAGRASAVDDAAIAATAREGGPS